MGGHRFPLMSRLCRSADAPRLQQGGIPCKAIRLPWMVQVNRMPCRTVGPPHRAGLVCLTGAGEQCRMLNPNCACSSGRLCARALDGNASGLFSPVPRCRPARHPGKSRCLVLPTGLVGRSCTGFPQPTVEIWVVCDCPPMGRCRRDMARSRGVRQPEEGTWSIVLQCLPEVGCQRFQDPRTQVAAGDGTSTGWREDTDISGKSNTDSVCEMGVNMREGADRSPWCPWRKRWLIQT